ncbi:MAG: DinB family protein [Bryobacteraceae bacterium]
MSEIAELLERFRRGPELLAVATTGASNPELDFSPGEGQWSARMIAAHLTDSEYVGAMRLRQVIAETHPTLIAWDEKAWAAGLNYGARKISAIVESFRRVRGDNYDLLTGLPQEAFTRTGNHTERGAITLHDLLRIYAEHAEGHARQIMTARQAYKNRAS